MPGTLSRRICRSPRPGRDCSEGRSPLICEGQPPADMRDLIDVCLRFYKKDGEGRIFERLPINFRISLNSPRFMNRDRMLR
jgi:hypothetical protein